MDYAIRFGLIEVMGLAVLPARLKAEIETLKNAMLSGADISANPEIAHHAAWADEASLHNTDYSSKNADEILKREVGAVFEQVLLDAGVYKRDSEGKRGFERFIESLGKVYIHQRI